MGNAGTVDFPTYMKTVHNDWLDHTGVDKVTTSVVDLINAAENPYTLASGVNPATALTAMDNSIATFSGLVTALDPTGDWADAVAVVMSELDFLDLFNQDHLDDLTDAFAATQDDQIDGVVLPKFRAGMRNLNAVMTSAYVMGEAFIYGMRNRDVAKFSTEIRAKLELTKPDWVGKVTDAILRNQITKTEFQKIVAHYIMEANRIRLVAEKEYLDTNIAFRVGEQKWPFEVYQLAGNILAAIGGGTAVYSDTAKGPSTMQSALSGALAGAALGAQIGGNWQSAGAGALLGGILGGIS